LAGALAAAAVEGAAAADEAAAAAAAAMGAAGGDAAAAVAVDEVEQVASAAAGQSNQPQHRQESAGAETHDTHCLLHSNAVAAEPTPRHVSPCSTCPSAPELPAAATEVAAALGWLPPAGQTGMLAVRLRQARSANVVCAVLLDCEDVKPAFNAARGGCNIDMQLILLRGCAVGELPVGLQVASPGHWC
jgi:hypothetical protein